MPLPFLRAGDVPRLLTFRGRVGRRPYMVLQLLSAGLLVAGILFLAGSVGLRERVPDACSVAGPVPFVRGWSFGAAVCALLYSMWIGATAVTRRARDGALPAAFVGVLYIINRLNLPITMGLVGTPELRELALLLAWIMLVVQTLLIARDTVPERDWTTARSA